MTPSDAKRIISHNMPLYLWFQMGRIAFESQMVIAMRMAGMMGIVEQSPTEPFRMVAEKQAAATEAFHGVVRAASRGQGYDRMMAAALRPYSRRTSANSRRLTRAKSR